MSWIFQSENLSNNCFFYFYLSLSCSLPVSSYLPLHYLSICLSSSTISTYLTLHVSLFLYFYVPLLSLSLVLTSFSLSLLLSLSLYLFLSLSFSSFLLMSASFLPSSNILSFMYRVLSKLCKCVDCKSMLKLSSSLSVMFSSYFYLKLICDSFYLIYFVSTNLSLPPNIFFLLHSSES